MPNTTSISREDLCAIPGYDPFRDAEGFIFDEPGALRFVQFIEECCHHVEGQLAGKPYILAPHERAIVANVFGWKDSNGLRRYREVFELIARKNSKTTFSACMILAVLFIDKEPGMQGYSTAADRDQASLVFRIASRMVAVEPTLNKRSTIHSTSKTITRNDNEGFFRAISAEAHSKHGYNTHLALNDELHAQPNADLIEVIETSMGARTQPLEISITTADYMRESVCNRKYDYACKVRDGIIKDARFLPVIFEFPVKMLEADPESWKNPEHWHLANPLIGQSVSREWLERECQKAIETPTYENTFKRLHLNIRTESDVRWLPMDRWDSCSGICPSVDGQPCYMGLDLASTTDIAAAVLLFPSTDNGEVLYDMECRFWIPQENARRREQRDGVPYLVWARDELITMTPGDVIDYDQIRADINTLNEQYEIREIAIDRWNSSQLQTQLIGDGFNVIQFGQGFRDMNAPSKELEKLIIGGQIRHGGNPVLRWMASNVTARMDPAGNIKPDKAKSTEKIDGIVALIMALGRAMVQEHEAPSVYETRGMLSL